MNIKELLKKSVPLYLALALAFNFTLGAGIIQYYFYKDEINKLIVYKEKYESNLANDPEKKAERLKAIVLPKEGVNTGIKWEDLGKRLVATGVIDEEKFLNLFKFSDEQARYRELLSGNSSENIILNESNSRFVLNTLWALGLTQKSDVLTDTQNKYEKDIGRLASTGGWTLGTADAMEFYGKNDILGLTEDQQKLISSITANIYRPCCGNNTAFPDCNHGMAMLGLVELMIAKGYSEDEIYDTALKVNSYWFPSTYLTLADYFEDKKNTKWEDVDAKLALGKDFSSGSGFRAIKAQVQPVQGSGSGGGCGV